ncbi:MAG: divalent-cation tolerance protein CutA [Gammaproteobacteria bacterium]
MDEQTEHLLVINTCPGSITAKNIANQLVADNLVACIQVMPGVQSYFRWAGKVEVADEHLLFIKTTAQRYSEVEKVILSLHPYELPEIITVPITGGLSGYLSWITETTQS